MSSAKGCTGGGKFLDTFSHESEKRSEILRAEAIAAARQADWWASIDDEDARLVSSEFRKLSDSLYVAVNRLQSIAARVLAIKE